MKIKITMDADPASVLITTVDALTADAQAFEWLDAHGARGGLGMTSIDRRDLLSRDVYALRDALKAGDQSWARMTADHLGITVETIAAPEPVGMEIDIPVDVRPADAYDDAASFVEPVPVWVPIATTTGMHQISVPPLPADAFALAPMAAADAPVADPDVCMAYVGHRGTAKLLCTRAPHEDGDHRNEAPADLDRSLTALRAELLDARRQLEAERSARRTEAENLSAIMADRKAIKDDRDDLARQVDEALAKVVELRNAQSLYDVDWDCAMGAMRNLTEAISLMTRVQS